VKPVIGGEEDGKTNPERITSHRPGKIVGELRRAHVGQNANEVGDDRRQQECHHHVLQARGDVGTGPRECEQPDDRSRGDHTWKRGAVGSNSACDRLTQTDRVERHGHRHGQVEDQSDGAAEGRPESARD